MSEPNEHIAAGDPNAQAHGIAAADHAPAESTFSDAQWAFLRAEDYSAGRAVVLLMLGIFSIGVFLYAAVAFTVSCGIGFMDFTR